MSRHAPVSRPRALPPVPGTGDVLNAPRGPILSHTATVQHNAGPSRMVTFYIRRTEATFDADPSRVARLFLAHPEGRRARRVSGTFLDRFPARFLVSQGAGWATPGQDDPHRTRAAYETVRRIVTEQMEVPA